MGIDSGTCSPFEFVPLLFITNLLVMRLVPLNTTPKSDAGFEIWATLLGAANWGVAADSPAVPGATVGFVGTPAGT